MKFVVRSMMAFLCSLLCFFSAMHANAKMTVRFQPHITVNAKTVDDILQIKGDPKIICHLHGLKLPSKPVSGEILTKENVIRWLKRQQHYYDLKLTWLGRTSATVEINILSTSEELVEKAQLALTNQLAKKYKRFQVSPLSKPQASGYAQSSFKPHVQADISSRMTVWLDNPQKSIPIQFKVVILESVLVATRPLAKHKTLIPQDFEYREKNIAAFNKPLTTLPHNSRLTKSLLEGSVLTQKSTEQIPLISRGQSVKVQVAQGAVRLSVEGIALSDGTQGQIISIQNPASNRVFEAKITGKATVEALP